MIFVIRTVQHDNPVSRKLMNFGLGFT